MVAVLDQITGFVNTPCTEVNCHHRFGASQRSPVRKFVNSNLVWFNGTPSKLQSSRPLFFRTDAVFPVVARHEVTARIAYDGYVQFIHQFQNVLPESLFIGCGMIGLVNTAVNCPAQVLQESPVHAGIHVTHSEIPIKNHFSFFCCRQLSSLHFQTAACWSSDCK